jgi:WD40 repeat protein
MRSYSLPFLTLCILMAACAPSQETLATQTAVAANSTAAAWTPTPTITPTATATPTPSATPIPSATPRPALPVGVGTPLPDTLNLKVISPENASQLRLVRSVPLDTFGPQNLIFSPDGETMLINPIQQAYGQSILLLDPNNGVYQTINGDGAVFSPDGKTIAIYYQSMGLKIYAFENGQPTSLVHSLDGIGHIRGSSPNPVLMSFSPDGSLFAGDSSSGIHIYNTSDWSEVDLIPARYADKRISPDWSTYALWSSSFVLRNYPEDTFITSGEYIVRNITFSPDSRYLAFNDFYGPVMIYDLTAPGQPFMVIEQTAQSYTQNSLAFSPDGQLLALACGENGQVIKIWRFPEATLLAAFPTSLAQSGLAFSPDGKMLAVGIYTSIWPAQNQTELWLLGIP